MRQLAWIPDAISRWYFARTPDAYRAAGIALLLLLGGTSLTLSITGASHQQSMPWDSVALLNAGWRLLTGDCPHVDYFAPIGFLHPALLAAVMRIAGPTANVLAYVPAIVAPLLGLLCWTLARRRLSALPALAVSALAALLIAGTYWLGAGLRSQSYAMQYNRLGWALLTLLVVYALLQPYDDIDERARWLDDMTGGAVFALICFVKINYVVVGAGMLITGIVLRSDRTRMLRGLLPGLAIGGIVPAAAIGFRFDAILDDVRTMAIVGLARRSPLSTMLMLAQRNAKTMLLATLSIAAALRVFWRLRDPRSGVSAALFAGAMVLGGLAVCSANMQSGDIPILALTGVVLAELARRRNAAAPELRVLAVLSLMLVFPNLARDLGSVVYSAGWAVQHRSGLGVTHIDAGPIASLPLVVNSRTSPEMTAVALASDTSHRLIEPDEYAIWVNDGLRLLRAEATEGKRVFTQDIVDPFSFALGLRSPRRNAYWWSYGLAMDEGHHPPTDTILASADFVMLPKRPLGGHSTSRFMAQLFAPGIQRDFQLRNESRLWKLYTRRVELRGPR